MPSLSHQFTSLLTALLIAVVGVPRLCCTTAMAADHSIAKIAICPCAQPPDCKCCVHDGGSCKTSASGKQNQSPQIPSSAACSQATSYSVSKATTISHDAPPQAFFVNAVAALADLQSPRSLSIRSNRADCTTPSPSPTLLAMHCALTV